jgi:threonine/homoserine/homoserine lactone efflux protein
LDSSLLLRGLALGFAIAAPVGPIGVLCIHRTLIQGRAAGLLSGLGAATADALYGSVAAFGLTAISGLLVAQRTWLGLLGGAFLCYLGARTFRERPVDAAALPPSRTPPGSLAGSYASTLALTLTNPMTILSFAAVFAGLGLGAGRVGIDSLGGAASLVTGVFLGSAGWWLVLSTGVSLLRGGLGAAGLRWVNRVSGVVVVAFGIGAILSVVAPLG